MEEDDEIEVIIVNEPENQDKPIYRIARTIKVKREQSPNQEVKETAEGQPPSGQGT